jgi:hypothetical protein
MADPKQFSRNIANVANNVVKNANTAKRKAALVIDQVLVITTPVDTGQARSNWIVQNTTPSRKQQPAFNPGSGGSTAAQNADKALSEGRATIAQAVPGAPIWISNNLPYIQGLNEGNSLQAPKGFVEKAVQQGVSAIDGFKILDTKLEFL